MPRGPHAAGHSVSVSRCFCLKAFHGVSEVVVNTLLLKVFLKQTFCAHLSPHCVQSLLVVPVLSEVAPPALGGPPADVARRDRCVEPTHRGSAWCPLFAFVEPPEYFVLFQESVLFTLLLPELAWFELSVTLFHTCSCVPCVIGPVLGAEVGV